MSTNVSAYIFLLLLFIYSTVRTGIIYMHPPIIYAVGHGAQVGNSVFAVGSTFVPPATKTRAPHGLITATLQ